MADTPKPPAAFEEFVARFPEIGRAWDVIAAAGQAGPLDGRTTRLVKLGIAMGSMREGAVGSAVRKALAAGASRAEVEQVIALAAGTIGLPSAVAVHTWTKRVFDGKGRSTT